MISCRKPADHTRDEARREDGPAALYVGCLVLFRNHMVLKR
jgi:hypothetical protein